MYFGSRNEMRLPRFYIDRLDLASHNKCGGSRAENHRNCWRLFNSWRMPSRSERLVSRYSVRSKKPVGASGELFIIKASAVRCRPANKILVTHFPAVFVPVSVSSPFDRLWITISPWRSLSWRLSQRLYPERTVSALPSDNRSKR